MSTALRVFPRTEQLDGGWVTTRKVLIANTYQKHGRGHKSLD